MADDSKSISGAATEGSAHLGLTREMLMITRVIFASRVGKALRMLVTSLVVVISATAYGQIRLNRWKISTALGGHVLVGLAQRRLRRLQRGIAQNRLLDQLVQGL